MSKFSQIITASPLATDKRIFYLSLGVLTLHFLIPGCGSLKEKRRRIKPLIHRLHREFNISVAEIDQHDIWQNTVIACALISNDHQFTQQKLSQITEWVETHWPDLTIINNYIEMI